MQAERSRGRGIRQVRRLAVASTGVALALTVGAQAAVQTYSAATGAGGVGNDHPGFGFFQYDPGLWDTGLDAGTTSPPAGEFSFAGSDGAFHTETRAILDVGFTGQVGDHAAYFQMNYNPSPPGASFGNFWFGGVGNDVGPYPKSGAAPVALAQVLVYADARAPLGKPMEFRSESQWGPSNGNGFKFAFTGTGTWQSLGGPLNLAVSFGNFDFNDPQIASLIAFGQNGNEISAVDDGLDPANVPEVWVDNLTLTIAQAAWSADASGNWSDNTMWDIIAPDGGNARAIFGSGITAPRTVTVDGERFAGTLVFDNVNSYTLGGTGTLNLRAINTDVASGTFAAINVGTGSHVIAAPLVLWSDTTVTVTPAGSTLAITGSLKTHAGTIISKAGAGVLQSENIRTAALNVAEGTVRISAKGSPNAAAGTSVVNALSIAAGAQLDLSNNSLVIDYSGAVGTLVDDTRQHLATGRMTSSSADSSKRLGYGDNAVLGQASFGGVAVDSSSVLIKFTFAGDANLDGQVDITDLGNLATNWQTTNTWPGGDFDYSGFVDITDLGMLATNWQAGVGSPLGPSLNEALASLGMAGAAVPEPAAVTGVGALALAMVTRRRRDR